MEYFSVEGNRIAANSVSLLMLLTLVYVAVRSIIVSDRRKSAVLPAIYMVIILIAVKTGSILSVAGQSETRLYSVVWYTIGSAALPLISPLLANALNENQQDILQKVFWIPGICAAVLAVLSPAFGLVFSVSAENVYSDGSWIRIYDIFTLLSLISLTYATWKARKAFPYRTRKIILLPYVFILAGTVLMTLLPDTGTDWGCMAAGIILYYLCLQEMMSCRDTLTGLLNRRAYEADYPDMAKRVNCYVIVLDIDDFRTCNDTYGSPYGDKCMRALSDVIVTTFDPIGYCYRLESDNFCIFCKTNSESLIKKKSDEFVKKIIDKRQENRHLPMISTGFAVYVKGTETLNQSIMRAEQQLKYFQGLRREGKPIPKQEETDPEDY